MRLLIVGSLQGQIGAATKIAMDRGAKVTHAATIEQGLAELRSGRGADLVFCDVGFDIGQLVRGLIAFDLDMSRRPAYAYIVCLYSPMA